LSGRLGRPVYWPLVALAALALWALALTLSPSAALAQQQSEDPTSDAPTVVVAHGDSLWSIAQEQLGPRASAGRVAKEAERIYGLNEALIGPDPNTIVVGQELALPRTGESSAAAPVRERGAVRDAAATEAGSGGRATEAATEAPAETAAEAAAPSLPAAPTVALVTPAGSVAPGSPTTLAGTARSAAAAAVAAPGLVVESVTQAQERQRLGLAIIALSLLVGALMARTLPMRRQQPWWDLSPGQGVAYNYGAAYADFYGRAESPGEELDAAAGADSPIPAARGAEPGIGAGADGTDEANAAAAGGEAVPTAEEQTNGHVTNGHVTNGHVTNGHVTNGHVAPVRPEVAGAARRRRLRRGIAVKRRPPTSPAARGGRPTGLVGPKVRRLVPHNGAETRARTPRSRGARSAAGFLRKRGVK
jgi:LysM repeat protein